MNDKKIDCLLLTGMHRSGLSALVNGLNLMGVDFGSDDKKETLGHTDPSTAVRDVVMIHDLLLRDLGCKWDMIGALPENWMETPAAENARERILQLIENRFENQKVWAVADPRLCRLLPLWISILQEKEIRPGVILTIRHPWEVAQALGKDNGIDARQSHLLWLAMNKEVFDACQRQSYLVHTYDQFLADPAAILGSIEEQFSLEFPYSLQQRIHRLLDAVRPELKHYHRSNFQQEESYYPFAWLYDQINNHRSALQLLAQENEEKTDADLIAREMPARFYPDTLPGLKKDLDVQKQSNQQGSKIFHSFLSLIGHYEREQRNLELQKLQRILSATRVSETLFARLAAPAPNEERGPETVDVLLAKNEWQLARFPIHHSQNLKTGGLTLYPLNTRGIVSISALSLVNIATEEVCWKAATSDFFETVALDNALRLPGEDALVIMTTTNDTAITLPELAEIPDGPLELHVWIKVDTSQEMAAVAWQVLEDQKERLKNERDGALEKVDFLSGKEQEWATAVEDREARLTFLKDEVDKRSAESTLRMSQIQELNRRLAESEKMVSDSQARSAELEQAVAALAADLAKETKQKDKLSAKLNEREEWIGEIEKELEKAGQQKEQLNQRLAEQDVELQKTSEEKMKFEQQLSHSSSELSRRQDRISELSKELKRDRHDLEVNAKTIKELRKSLDERSANLKKTTEELRTRVAEHQTELNELKREKGRLEERVVQGNQALDDAKESIAIRFAEIVTVTKILQEREALLAENQKAVNVQKEKIQQIEKEKKELLSKQRVEADAQETKLRQVNEKLARLTDHNAIAQRQVHQLQEKMGEKDLQLKDQTGKIEEVSAELAQKGRKLIALEKKIESQDAHIETQENHRQRLNAELDAKKRLLREAREEKTRLAKELVQKEKSIQAKDIEIELQKNRVEKVKRSASWKLTTPLRAMGRPFKKRPYKAEPAELQIEQIRASEYFNPNWYLEQYPDVAENKLDPAEHYFYFGVSEGRDPGPGFNTTGYMKAYPDIADTGMNPLVHYVKFGKEEGRSPDGHSSIRAHLALIQQSDLFDAEWYLEHYSDVKESGVDPVEHYCLNGATEGRNPGPGFDTTWYVETYPDVANAGINPLVHFLMFGEKEGRECKRR